MACSIFTDLGGLSGGSTDGDAPDGDDAAVDAGGADTSASDGSPDATRAVDYRAAVLADKPIAYLRFGEKSGVLASDETGNGNTGAVSGDVVWGVPGALGSDTDTAIRLDGRTSLIDLGGKIDFLGTSPFSLELWLNATTVDSTYRFLVAKDARPTTGREEWGIVFQDPDGLYFERYVAGTNRGAGTAVTSIVGRWVYVVATYDGTQLAFFVDGAAVGQTPDSRSQLSKNVPLTAGAASPSGGGVFDGTIDELAVYDVALSPTRIKAHFDAASAR